VKPTILIYGRNDMKSRIARFILISGFVFGFVQVATSSENKTYWGHDGVHVQCANRPETLKIWSVHIEFGKNGDPIVTQASYDSKKKEFGKRQTISKGQGARYQVHENFDSYKKYNGTWSAHSVIHPQKKYCLNLLV